MSPIAFIGLANMGAGVVIDCSTIDVDSARAVEAAARAGGATPLGALAEAQYALFERLGYGAKDFSAVLQLLRGRVDALSSQEGS